MPNPFNTTQNSNTNTLNLNDIYQLLSTSKNPVEMFNNIAKNNPNMAPVLNLLNNGYSPQQVFNTLCQQRGINPQEFMKKLTK